MKLCFCWKNAFSHFLNCCSKLNKIHLNKTKHECHHRHKQLGSEVDFPWIFFIGGWASPGYHFEYLVPFLLTFLQVTAHSVDLLTWKNLYELEIFPQIKMMLQFIISCIISWYFSHHYCGGHWAFLKVKGKNYHTCCLAGGPTKWFCQVHSIK